MANFVITTQKPTSSEIEASKPKTASKGAEDAFNSLMAHKEIQSSRPAGEQDHHRGKNQQQRQKGKDIDAKKHRDIHSMQQQMKQAVVQPRHTIHTAVPMAMAPSALIQRKQKGGQSKQGRQKNPQLKIKGVKGKEQKNNGLDVRGTSEMPDVESEQEIGSVFDELDFSEEISEQPAQLNSDQSIFDMLDGLDESNQRKSKEFSVMRERVQVETKPRSVPGQSVDQHSDMTTDSSAHSSETKQLLAAAMAKTSDHYPEGSIGRALQEGKLSQESLHKLFEQWRIRQQKGQQKGQHHHRPVVPIPHVKPQAMIIPNVRAELELQGRDSSGDDTSKQAESQLAESVEKIYDYIQQQIIESVWVAQSPHALAEGVVVKLAGDLVAGSRFLVRKKHNKIEVVFYIENEQFYDLALEFKDSLALAIQKKCEASAVDIRYHRLEKETAKAVLSTMTSRPHIEENDDDLWGD